MRPAIAACALLLAGAAAGAARAQPESEDPELAFVPPSSAAPVATIGGGERSLRLENALVLAAPRSGVSGARPRSWEDRLYLDLRQSAPVGRGLDLHLSGRLNLRFGEGLEPLARETIRLDLREAYLSGAPGPQTFVDAGRINLKSGVALGWNPTDVFKTRAVVEPLSADPSALRAGRLGAAMIRGQQVFEQGSVTLAYAPKLADPSRLYLTRRLPSLDPMLDRTNAAHRLLVKASVELTDDLSPEVLYYRDDNGARAGVNLTTAVGERAILYAEWTGGRRHEALDEALLYGRRTGEIPAQAHWPLGRRPQRAFLNELAAGLSYTTGARIVLNAEYHYSEAGLSGREWEQLHAAVTAGGPAGAQLRYVRAYAAEHQLRLSQHAAFLRVSRSAARTGDLELAAFALIDLQDGSAFGQLSVERRLSDAYAVGLIAAGGAGPSRSSLAGSSTAASLALRIARDF